jgi:hypothetical protein
VHKLRVLSMVVFSALLLAHCSDDDNGPSSDGATDGGTDAITDAANDAVVIPDMFTGDIGNIGTLCSPGGTPTCTASEAKVVSSTTCQSDMCLVLLQFATDCVELPAFCTKACQSDSDCPPMSNTCATGYACKEACPSGYTCGQGATGKVCICTNYPAEW